MVPEWQIWYREVHILIHNFLYPLWHKKFHKIVECRTFKLTIYAIKYTKIGKWTKLSLQHNLGTSRLAHRPIIINFPLRLIPPPFNFWCITIGNYFVIFDFSLSSACAKVRHRLIQGRPKSQLWKIENQI